MLGKAGKGKTRAVKINLPRKQLYLFWSMAMLVLSSFVFQLFSAYNHCNFNTDLARTYDERFNSERMISNQVRAATALKEYHQKGNWGLVTNNTDSLDYVLGFFDDLGYDEQHGKISAETIHQYFFDDIFYFYQGSLTYIASAQKTDPSYFENIKPLFNEVSQIEIKKTGRVLRFDDKDYMQYLQSEIDLNNTK